MTVIELLGVFVALFIGLGIGVALSRFQLRYQMLQRINQERQPLVEEAERLKKQLAVLEANFNAAEQRCEQQQLVSESAKQDNVALQSQLLTAQTELAALKSQDAEKQRSHDKELAALKGAKDQLTKEFESLAHRIFDEKTERFSKSSQQNLDGVIKPLREQLSDFKKRVEEVYDKETRDRTSLAAELNQLKQLNLQMSEDAVNLTKALKGDNKAQGNWGEVILERVLEESGLRKDHEYKTQVSMTSAEGNRRAPDVVVHLPENKDIVIDSKVSLVDYERYCRAETDTEKQQALKAHAQSVRNHILQLSKKNYEDLEGLKTLDFVFIFIPIEAAFMTAFEFDQSLYRDAYEKNIIIVGPTTLLATLRTVQSIWRYERQNTNVEEIARQAGAMHDRFVGFIDDLNKISQYIDKASDAQIAAMKKLSTGRGNLVNSTLKLEKLGAKIKKKIPESMIEEAVDSELDSLPDPSKTHSL